MVLDQNGYARFTIKQVDDTDEQGNKKLVWRIIVKPGDEDKPKYALYTGTETAEVKEMMRLIFNRYFFVFCVYAFFTFFVSY